MLKGIYYGKYKKLSQSTGQRITVFKYAVSGTEQELAKYKAALEAQGQPCHVEEFDETHKGKMIYFTTVHNGKNIELQVSPNNAIFVPNDKIDELQSKLEKVNDPALKAALATEMARIILGAPASKSSQVSQDVDSTKNKDLVKIEIPKKNTVFTESKKGLELESQLQKIKDPSLKMTMAQKVAYAILNGYPEEKVKELENNFKTIFKLELAKEKPQNTVVESPTLEPTNKKLNKIKEQFWVVIGVIIVGSFILFYVIPQLKLFIYANATVIALVAIVWLYLESKK
ncbi:MAG TPA: hypothetical protein VIN73_03035 [Vicingaceae bacterium]